MTYEELAKMEPSGLPGRVEKFSAPGDFSLTVWREAREKRSFELAQGERVLDASVNPVSEKELSEILAQYGLRVEFPERYAKRYAKR